MIVYTANKARFRQDVTGNDIGGIIFDTFKAVTGHSTNRAEINDAPAIPADAGVAIEYHLPRSSKRTDAPDNTITNPFYAQYTKVPLSFLSPTPLSCRSS